MSPHAALHEPGFREAVGVGGGLLLVAGLLLGVLQFIFRITLGNVWKTYQSWLWMAPLAAIAIFAGEVVFMASVAAVAVMAFREFARASRARRDYWKCAAVGVGMIGLALALTLPARSPNAYGY